MRAIEKLIFGQLLMGSSTPVMGGGGRRYYVDATSGDDDNTGRSPSNAWQTIARINAHEDFRINDRILFKRGETWVGTSLQPPRNGLLFQAYGDNETAPIISGDDTSDCVFVNEKEDIQFMGIDLVSGLNSCFHAVGSSGIEVINCNTEGAGNDNILIIAGCNNILIRGGTHATPYERVGGALVSCIEIADGGSNFLIEDVICQGSANAGIAIHNHAEGDPQGQTEIPTNVTLRNCTVVDNTGWGISILAQDISERPAIVVDGCTAHDNAQGLRIHKSAASGYYPQGVTVQNCALYNNDVYDFYVQGDDCEFIRNVSYGTDNQNFIVDSKRLSFYNNTIYRDASIPAFPIYHTGARCEDITWRNNIICQNSTDGYVIGFAADTVDGADVDYNIYYFPNAASRRWMWDGVAKLYSEWRADTGQDANSPATNTDDIMFVDPSNGDLSLQASSPAIDAGVEIAGVTDSYLGDAPDLGYVETA